MSENAKKKYQENFIDVGKHGSISLYTKNGKMYELNPVKENPEQMGDIVNVQKITENGKNLLKYIVKDPIGIFFQIVTDTEKIKSIDSYSEEELIPPDMWDGLTYGKKSKLDN